MPNEINPETILSTTEKPLTLLRWLRAIQKTNAQITEKLTELENTLNGKVAKAGDTMTGDLSVPNINVNNNANVGKLNTEKINQKYVGAIKSELHVDEQGIVEFVNGSNAGRFDTAKVIKPSEVKTEIYDNQEGKRMFFRLPYLEASAGEHRLLTEEDLGGGGDVDIDGYTEVFSPQTGDYNFNITFKVKTINTDIAFFEVVGSVGSGQSLPLQDELFRVQLPDNLANKIKTISGAMVGSSNDHLLNGIVKGIASATGYGTNALRLSIGGTGKTLLVYGPNSSSVQPSGSYSTLFNFTGMVVAKHE